MAIMNPPSILGMSSEVVRRVW